MTEWVSACRCGRLKATCTGAPKRNSVCHCFTCKQRTGSAFAWNATFARGQVAIDGESRVFETLSAEGRWSRMHFCPTCGITVYYEIETRPDMVSVPAGDFPTLDFPEPGVEVFGERRNAWVRIAPEEAPAQE